MAGNRQRPTLERVRVTRVGLGFILLTLVVGFAAVNTGNNALYMVEAMMLALLAVSGLASRRNLRELEIEVFSPGEVFANQPFSLRYRIRCRDRLAAKRWLNVSASERGGGELVPFLAAGASHGGRLPQLVRRRGRHRVDFVRSASIFPLGLFHKVMRYAVDLEMLVYPEIYPASREPVRQTGRIGDESARRVGWGQELLSLRDFRPGDDPRAIHWKQTARTGRLIFVERETDEGRRLSIQFDNGVGELLRATERSRFERLVSEAASAAVQHLKAGYEVELLTRDRIVPFGRGRTHQMKILETLALVEPRTLGRQPLRSGDPQAPQMRLGFEAAARTAG